MQDHKKIETVLPWQNVPGSDGYARLDQQVVVDEEFGRLIVRRHKPTETTPGDFVAYHNDKRIGRNHALRSMAQADAERYFYSLPQFSKSGPAAVLNVVIENGRKAYRDGLSIYQNPHPRTSINQNQWVAGWLMQYGDEISMTIIEPTLRANNALEDDLKIATARLQAFNVVLDYMSDLCDDKGLENRHTNEMEAIKFVRLFKAGDVDAISRDFPGWSQYLFNKKLGPAVEPENLGGVKAESMALSERPPMPHPATGLDGSATVDSGTTEQIVAGPSSRTRRRRATKVK